MPVHVNKLIEALALLSEEKNLKATVVGSVKGGVLTGIGGILGGLILGPVGFAVGGTIAGFASAVLCAGKFQPVAIVLRNMPYAKKQLLYRKIKMAFTDLGIEDVTAAVGLILTKPTLQNLAIKVVEEFLKNDMGLYVKS